MKIKWKYLKKTPVIIGAVVLFFLVLWLLNRSASASSSNTTAVANGGPDPNAVLASQTQLAGMQIQAGLAAQGQQLDYAKAQLDADASLQALAVQSQLANNQLVAQQNIADANIALQDKALQYNYQQSVNNNQFALDYANQAYDYSLANTTISANLQAHLADNQLDAYKFGTAISVIPSLKKGDRDAALISLALGKPSSHGSVGSTPSNDNGGFNVFGVISPITNIIG